MALFTLFILISALNSYQSNQNHASISSPDALIFRKIPIEADPQDFLLMRRLSGALQADGILSRISCSFEVVDAKDAIDQIVDMLPGALNMIHNVGEDGVV